MYKQILVPLDGSANSDLSLATALELAKAFGARMRLVHVVDEMAYPTGYDQFGGYSGALTKAMREAGQQILDQASELVAAAGVESDQTLYDEFGAHLAETVAEAAKVWGADLIVVGTHGRRGMGRFFMGSGAEQIIRLSPVPVLVVRSPKATPLPAAPDIPQAAPVSSTASDAKTSAGLIGT